MNMPVLTDLAGGWRRQAINMPVLTDLTGG